MKRSVAVLGLDGMPWSYLKKLFNYGVMPYTKHLVQKSFNAVLEAYPPSTPPSWASIMTGVNPGKHGIFGFFHYDRKSWKQRLYTALDLEHPRVHEMLSMIGQKSIVFNPIPDYPIIPVSNAIIISNLFFTPKPLSTPHDAYKKYFKNEDPQKYTTAISCRILEDYVKVLEIYEEAIDIVLKDEYSLLWINLNIPDIFFHRCPEILHNDHILKGEFKVFGKLDKIVELLRENHDTLILVSDHGFSKYDMLVSVNDILIRHGLAKASSHQQTAEVGDYRIKEHLARVERPKEIKIPPTAYKLIKRLKITPLARWLLNIYKVITGSKVIVQTSKWINIKDSEAFIPDHYAFGVYIKDKAKLPAVMNILKRYSSIITVLNPYEFYEGPLIDRAPDIVVFPNFNAGYTLGGSNIIGSPVTKGKYYGHHPSGILIVSTDYARINLSETITVPNYIVGSLVLWLLNQPLPKTRDRFPVLDRELLNNSPEYNYAPKWKVLVKIYRRVRS